MRGLFGPTKPKAAKGGDETYATDVALFHELNTRVRAVDAAVKSYDRQITAITPLLKRMADTISTFYSDSHLSHGAKFMSASETIQASIATFAEKQEQASKAFQDYLTRIAMLKKAVSEHDKLFEDMKDKEKTALREKKPDKKQIADERFNAAKDLYESKHEEVAADLHVLVSNRFTDFEPIFKDIVKSQISLFSQMSNAFDMPDLGLTAGGGASRAAPKASPAPAYSPAPATSSYSAPPPATPSYSAPPPATPSYSAPPPATPSYSAPPPATPSYSAPPPATPTYSPQGQGLNISPPQQASRPPPTPSYGTPAPAPTPTAAPAPAPPTPNYGTPSYSAPAPTPSYNAAPPPTPAYNSSPPATPSYNAAPPPTPSYNAAPPTPTYNSAPPPTPSYSAAPPTPAPTPLGPGKLAIVPIADRAQYEDLFMQETAKSGEQSLDGQTAFNMFSRSGLSNDDLGFIWELSDQDQDGKLTMEEFVLALYLINSKRRGFLAEIPKALTPELTIPTS